MSTAFFSGRIWKTKNWLYLFPFFLKKRIFIFVCNFSCQSINFSLQNMYNLPNFNFIVRERYYFRPVSFLSLCLCFISSRLILMRREIFYNNVFSLETFKRDPKEYEVLQAQFNFISPLNAAVSRVYFQQQQPHLPHNLLPCTKFSFWMKLIIVMKLIT